MPESLFDALAEQVNRCTPVQALEHLQQVLRERGDGHALFQAELLQARWDLGLPLWSSGTETIPDEKLPAFEERVKAAARRAGGLFLEAKDFAAAWPYFRMIQEHGPIAAALERADLTDDEQVRTAIGIAFQEGAHPTYGFDLLLKHYGICNAITTVSQGFPFGGDVRAHAIRTLVRTLHRDLHERLAACVGLDAEAAKESTIARLIAGRDDLFADEAYHLDVSHLSSVVQFAIELDPCSETELALDLCTYGQKLAPRYRFGSEPPFEDNYADYAVYFRTLLGRDEDAGLAHFRAKAEAAGAHPEESAPAQVYVHLLAARGRWADAVAAFGRYLTHVDPRRLACPTANELCQKLGDFAPLAEIQLRRGDPVQYLAALLAAKRDASTG